MTIEAYSSLPFSAGGAVATAAGRGVLWAVAIYMREPARNTAVAALIGLSVLAGGNALYKQAHHHPAPLFGSFQSAPSPARAKAAKPVIPAARPAGLAIDTTETTGSLAAQPSTPAAAPVIGNDEVLALQKKLAALNLFTGTADGLFGSRTARAIKAFEQSVGRPQRGLLTPQVLALIEGATLPVQPATASLPTLAQSATAQAKAPVPVALPAPSPLLASSSALAAVNSSSMPLAIASTSDDAAPAKVASLDAAQHTATQVLPMSDAPVIPKRVVQTIAVHAETGQPMPSALAPDQYAGDDASTDPDTVAAVQRGLNSLGFLHGEIDGVAGEATAKAVRNFEVFYNYEVTGRITRGLVELLKDNGATT